METLEALNRSFFLALNGTVDTAPWVVNTAMAVGDYVIYLIPLLLVALWLWGDGRRRKLALMACVVAMTGVGINQVIPLFWVHPRPFMIGLGHTWIPHAADSSFPSDHMTVLAEVGLTLLIDGAFWFGLATLMAGASVAWARVFLGVHFPLDMLGAVGVAMCSHIVVSPPWHLTGSLLTGDLERWYRLILARPIAAGWVRR